MRLALFSDTYLPQVNGVANTLVRMKEYMESQGIEHRLFVPGAKSPAPQVETSYGVPFPMYPELKMALPGYGSITRSLDKFAPDVVHLVTPFAMGLAGLQYARSRKVPIVASYHTNFPQYMEYFNMPFLTNTVWSYCRWFHSFAQINFCPSRDTQEILESQGFGNLMLWGRGIDTVKFSPQWRDSEIRKQYAPGKELIFLYVGRLSPEKEIDVLLDAAVILNQQGLDYKMVLVGDGPSRDSLEQRKVDNVVFAGYKTGSDLSRYYASADAFVFASPSETYGNVILEAMASGLPVVAVNAGGVKENLRDGLNGMATAPGCAVSMAEALMKLRHPLLRTSMGEVARRHALKQSWDSVFGNLFSQYGDLLGKRNVA